MTSRERVEAALRHAEPDRVPLDIGGGQSTSLVVEAYDRFKRHIGLSAPMRTLQEIYRVLAPGGRLLIWDAIVPTCSDESKELVAFLLRIILPNEEVQTGYGARWPKVQQDLEVYSRLAKEAGYVIEASRKQGHLLFLELRKPYQALDESRELRE